MEVIKWIEYNDNIDKLYPEAPYDKDHRDAIIRDLMKSGNIIYGDIHQAYNYKGIPVFEDGYLMVTMRTWGEMMSEVMNIREGHYKYTYLDFYREG